MGRGRRAALAARDVRLPPRLARDPPARGRPSRRRSRRSAPARPPSTELVARRHARRGPRHVPGDRGRPGAVRRRELPPLRRQLHVVGVGRRPTCSSSPATPADRRRRGAAAADARRRPAVRVERGPPDGRADPRRRCSTIRRTAPAIAAPRRPPGGDARLLGLEQGIRVPGRGLDAPPGAGGHGRGGARSAASS